MPENVKLLQSKPLQKLGLLAHRSFEIGPLIHQKARLTSYFRNIIPIPIAAPLQSVAFYGGSLMLDSNVIIFCNPFAN